MRHPSSRAERRYARFLAQRRYNQHLRNVVHYRNGDSSAQENGLWNHGGKRCEAHGNRCAHSLIERHERRREIKRLRRLPVPWPVRGPLHLYQAPESMDGMSVMR